MAKKTIEDIKLIEEEIVIALQVLRNEFETLMIIKDHSSTKSPESDEANIIIKDELEESVSNLEELIDLHKNLEDQLDKLEILIQDVITTKI